MEKVGIGMTSELTLVNKARSTMRRVAWGVGDTVTRASASARTFPQYLILGAQRAGTTSLQRVLMAHPDVVGPRMKKGVHYFDMWYERGPLWYRSQFTTMASRARHLRRTGHALVTGEASPYYFFHPAIPGRIHELVPDVKMIALLRDPTERAMSHHKHEVRRGYEELGLAEAIEAEESRLEGESERLLADPNATSYAHQHYSYVARGQYADQIERYLELFPRDQLLILEAETFWESPLETLAEVLVFLDLRPWAPDEYPRVNATRPTTVDSGLRRLLEERFADSNARLSSLAGRSLRWA
jgi:hypothetical protein